MNRGLPREYHQPRSVLATHVTPAILPKDFGDLYSRIGKVATLVDWVQIDVVDGEYAPNKTWPHIHDEGGLFAQIVKQDEPMPFWDEMNFEVDLMVKDPAYEADQWIAAGAMRVVVHMDSLEKSGFVDLVKKIESKGVEVVVAFGTESSHEKLAEYLEAIGDVDPTADPSAKKKGKSHRIVNTIQCMGIKKIGFQGEALDEKVFDNIKKIKEEYPYMLVSVDGSVNSKSAENLIAAGADRLIVGSALFSDTDSTASIEEKLSTFSHLFKK